MLIIPRDFRGSLVIGPDSHVISAASIHDASGIFYLGVSGESGRCFSLPACPDMYGMVRPAASAHAVLPSVWLVGFWAPARLARLLVRG